METEMIVYQGLQSPRPTKAQLYRLLTEVKHQISTRPHNYNQQTFCGTACCIGGTMFELVTGLATRDQKGDTVTEFAVWCLGGDDENIPWVLSSAYYGTEQLPNVWPMDLGQEYMEAVDAQGRAVVGCKAIDRWMAEQGIMTEADTKATVLSTK